MFSSWWSCLGRIRFCLLEEVCHWGRDLRFQKLGYLPLWLFASYLESKWEFSVLPAIKDSVWFRSPVYAAGLRVVSLEPSPSVAGRCLGARDQCHKLVLCTHDTSHSCAHTLNKTKQRKNSLQLCLTLAWSEVFVLVCLNFPLFKAKNSGFSLFTFEMGSHYIALVDLELRGLAACPSWVLAPKANAIACLNLDFLYF